jgi:adenosylcobinamide kinase / adenosylcobinamide-phosphate guanylyltransferase
MSRLVFVTGGARSGKSRFAQSLTERCEGELLYVATAGIGDSEMAERVRRHRDDRGARWQTLEEPLDLAVRLPHEARDKGGVLVDCITLWVTNLLFHHGEASSPVLSATDELVEALRQVEAPVFVVTNEVGEGIVPENRLARLFRDVAGEVNQRLAAASDEAWLVVAGLPVRLK